MPNHLDDELSPYLRQHRLNPVDWYPWGEEAFELARKQDKPIFLSIGYATCHWCHVMEHESFEDKEVAAVMNRAFISIKVDREERPDIDQVYMTYCQLSTGHGGWPLTIVMTPDKQPFFAATYLPKRSRFGRVGMMDLVPRVEQLWATRKDQVIASAVQNVAALHGAGEWEVTQQGPAPGIMDFAFRQLEEHYDPDYGGFGNAPKFPSPHQLQFLLRYARRTADPQVAEKATEMASFTLKQMRNGGVFDHFGFGFHRYATDQHWLLPHFEKMLYDQAMIALAAVDAYQSTRDEAFKEIADKIFAYVLRDMLDEAGGFYSAEDADSEGVEGKFYVWSIEELKKHLDDESASLVAEVYNFNAAGNFHDESTGELTGDNIPHLTRPLAEIASERNLTEDVLREKLEHAREKLFEVREHRVHPLKDDKVLTDWNGLMIAALSRAARVFDNPSYAEAASKAVDFIRTTLTTKEGRLLHRYREGTAGIQANLDDYAFMVYGLLHLYEANFDAKHLQHAITLAKVMIEQFGDEAKGGFFFTARDAESLIARNKEAYDGAMPSGNSIALLNLLHIGRITGDAQFEEHAAQLMRMFAQPVNRQPMSFSALLAGVDFVEGPAYEIVIVGEPGDPDTQALISEVRAQFLPNKVVLLKDSRNIEALSEIAPYTKDMKALNGYATVYVCENYQCNQPVTEVVSLRELLR